MNRNNVIIFIIALISTGVFLESCSREASDSVQLSQQPFEKLSEYQFFVGDMAALQPNEGVLPYDLNTPLFSDYAEKARFVWMPPGSAAEYTTGEVLDFPEGAILIKNFYYTLDQTQADSPRRIMETRLLVKEAEKWESVSYIWNEEQTDADLSLIGDIKEVAWTNRVGEAVQVNYAIPNKNQCKGCHSYDTELRPIGPKVRNLNKEYTYPDGTFNQLEKWAAVGYLKGYEPGVEHPKVANWEKPEDFTLHERAMAYLDVNCAHCHNPHGPASVSGLNLTAFQEVNINLGIYKAPVSAAKGSGGNDYSIVPGHPEQSILVYRMASTDPGAMMPESGRVLVHEEGLALIEQWVAELE